MQYTVLATSVVNVHWRSQYGANGATAHPPPECQGPLLQIVQIR